ncbi:hypothetical protein PHYBLDRAFT_157977 [Phycomyces blakesleeanus NRRL 1555(-)]|uniref:Uncharacterized protein n=1 Tax=Phycomyces blakesleeanus (strain ATCC 8743b / DSM 1359 / FGSC 10004 / NBRC 33097 / NRRL 1555) TaxID=763407 RepID=A0A167NV48_PHYB8|nr:hypothetical protein PHYBLDRAFT_157977 [Phycomyces blakesleeanus NRRL 1555(-)]OAD76679.1 hypothetical protein PHYBLDRAFT_157977 [Phycomyces blakesleeanus NRRL 1555(-)]|eukprot:XP_018294719.1 hypothetical protein PHYBLDRAFT_157977 [Phycomyces blakesleeanus NRRL 1555(-)]
MLCQPKENITFWKYTWAGIFLCSSGHYRYSTLCKRRSMQRVYVLYKNILGSW